MKMAHKLQNLLMCSDHELFKSGACHVFADELCNLFHDTNYILSGVFSERWILHADGQNELYESEHLTHVVAIKDGFVIDVDGVICEKDYLEEYLHTHREQHGPTCFYKKACLRICSYDALFKVKCHEDEIGPMSLDRLYLHPDFVRNARIKARMLIESQTIRFDIRFGQVRPKVFFGHTSDDNYCEDIHE